MKKLFFFVSVLFISISLSAQQEASNWYFGDNAGIQFNANGTVTALNNGQLSTDEGCSSISDGNGNLLFYTDGITVFDRNGTIMQNGFGLFGDPSSTQSGIIVPNPQFDTIFYIFTVDTINQGNPGTDQGFNYSVVDMSMNGGLGRVIEKNNLLLRDSSEKISAVLSDCQSEEIWVITYSVSNAFTTQPFNGNEFNTFYAFKVSGDGVDTNPQISGPFTSVDDPRGYLKFSPDGTKLACANATDGLFLYDFDSNTGIVSNEFPININFSPPNPLKRQDPYGLEFSPNNQFLYVSAAYNPTQVEFNNPNEQYSSLFQFEVTSPDINASSVLLDDRQMYRSALQLGPDGKIYRTASSTYNFGLPFLTYINNPNEKGLLCEYNHSQNRINLTNNSRQGLPPFITSFFTENIDIINNPSIDTTFLPLCEGDIYTLVAEDIPNATYIWTFNDVVQPTPAIPYEFEVTQNGLYKVLIELNNGNCETFEGEALVEYSNFPEAFTPSKLEVCDDEANDKFYNFDLTSQNSAILNGQDPNLYSVHYYRNENDAINDRDEITGLYRNTTNPEEIFVRVKSINNANCFVTNDSNTGQLISFLIEVYDTPIISRLDDVVQCDDEGDTSDGITLTNLESFNNDILGPNQNASDFTITYHSNFDDADNSTNTLPVIHSNNPFNDEIFVRIENNSNPLCASIDSFSLIVNINPVANDISLFQCDEDGSPDGRTVFNIIEKEEEITSSNSEVNVDYYLNMTDALSETNPIDASNYTNIISPQIIIARVNNTTTNCFSFSEVILEVSATSANDAYLGICDTDGEEDGFIDFDLSMANEQILEGLPTGLNLAYYTSLDDALLELNPLPINFRNTSAFNQTIFVRVENNNNCYGINEIELEVFTLPNVITEEETLYCLNTFPDKIVLTGGVINDIPNNYYYEWSTGETTIEIEVNEPGTYTVIVSNVAGCSKERTITVEASDIASIDNIVVTDVSENNTVTVLISGVGNYEFALDNPNGLYQASNVFENVKPGIYTVYVRDINGCGIAEELVSVIGFPKFFTPNGDGQNDFWQVKGVSSQFQPDTLIYIFDKYGKLLSEINPLGSGWDGDYNGNPMPTSDYWFSVTLQDGRRFSSHFTLKR